MADDLLNILDSEAIEMGKVVAWAQEQRHTRKDLESFRKEVINRFAEVGFLVNVLCYDTTEPEVYAFDFEVYGRCEPKAFDFDKMVHEVTHNLIGDKTAQEGFIPSDAATDRQAAHYKHKHGPGCD